MFVMDALAKASSHALFWALCALKYSFMLRCGFRCMGGQTQRLHSRSPPALPPRSLAGLARPDNPAWQAIGATVTERPLREPLSLRQKHLSALRGSRASARTWRRCSLPWLPLEAPRRRLREPARLRRLRRLRWLIGEGSGLLPSCRGLPSSRAARGRGCVDVSGSEGHSVLHMTTRCRK